LAVITIGERIPAGDALRNPMQHLHRKISRWASEAGKRYGVEVFYRGTEFTIDRACTFHPHANVIYAPRKPLPPDRWAEFLTWTQRFLGAWWKDCGTLAKPDEAIKYPFKPADLDYLADDQYGWLYGELTRLKLAQPMGSFKDFCRALEIEREKISFVATPRGGGLARVRRAVRSKKTGKPGDSAIDQENKILARTAPMPHHTPFWEPHSIVQNYTESPKTEGGAHRLTMLGDRNRRARRDWDANGAPAPADAAKIAKDRG
jgi:hypothetical protein